MDLSLEPCGCQLPTFRCTLCKQSYTYCLLPTSIPLSYHYPEYIPKLPTYPLSYSAYYSYPATPIYYRYKTCVSRASVTESERSAECPKKVYPGRYICARCKVDSMNKLYESKTPDMSLQMLLELKR